MLRLGTRIGTVRKALKHPEPNATTRNRSAPKLGPFQGIIDQILVDNETAPPEQRHASAQVFRRLRDEHGYRGGYGKGKEVRTTGWISNE